MDLSVRGDAAVPDLPRGAAATRTVRGGGGGAIPNLVCGDPDRPRRTAAAALIAERPRARPDAFPRDSRRRATQAWPSPSFPTTLPLLGNAVAAAPAFMRFLLRQAKKHDGLFLFWPGGPAPMCVVANAAAAKKVLADSKTYRGGVENLRETKPGSADSRGVGARMASFD